MTENRLFPMLYALTKHKEETDETPLYFNAGLFVNTAGEDCLDAEFTNGGAALLYDDADIYDLFTESGYNICPFAVAVEKLYKKMIENPNNI